MKRLFVLLLFFGNIINTVTSQTVTAIAYQSGNSFYLFDSVDIGMASNTNSNLALILVLKNNSTNTFVAGRDTMWMEIGWNGLPSIACLAFSKDWMPDSSIFVSFNFKINSSRLVQTPVGVYGNTIASKVVGKRVNNIFTQVNDTGFTGCFRCHFNDVKYRLNLSSTPYNGGYTSGNGNYAEGYCQISASPADGFHFKCWNDGVTTNPRTVYLTQDTSFVAVFETESFKLTVHSNNDNWGDVGGSGIYPYRSRAKITATPADHHHFVRWYGSNETLYNSTEIITINGDMEYYACFAIDTYYVSVVPSNIMYGRALGGGTFQYGEPCTVEATAYSGYRFIRWSNGVLYNPYTFVPTADMELTAVFADEGSVVNLNVNVNDPNMGSVIGGGPYAAGMIAEVEAVPNAGYHFVRWDDGTTTNPRKISMSKNKSITAYFASGTLGITETDNNGIGVYVRNGHVVVTGAEGETVRVFDITGRLVSDHGLAAGVYYVKVGNYPARKIAVIK